MVNPRRTRAGATAERIWRRGGELELLHRSMGFAALGLVTLMPLLIVVAAAAPFQRTGFAQWVVDGMGLSPHPAGVVRRLFATPGRVLSTTSALSLASLAVFGLSFAASVETGYRKVWDLPAGPWHSVWRRAVWLAGLTAYLFAEAQSGAFLEHGARQAAVRITLTLVFGVLFFCWGQQFLLGGLITWRAALPGAVLTMAGLVGLRGFSWLVFSPLIVTNAVTYGPVGTVLMVQCWLIGVGFVVFGGPLLGREFPYGRGSYDAGADTGPVGDAEPAGEEAGTAEEAGASDAAMRAEERDDRPGEHRRTVA
ncbi:ribonuclease BN [Actinacidiphila alni]|uniref:ribonuclease BN n=1 Tax=Actinacidiphila alni TaxID=380248 RepID=UPI0034555271